MHLKSNQSPFIFCAVNSSSNRGGGATEQMKRAVYYYDDDGSTLFPVGRLSSSAPLNKVDEATTKPMYQLAARDSATTIINHSLEMFLSVNLLPAFSIALHRIASLKTRLLFDKLFLLVYFIEQ